MEPESFVSSIIQTVVEENNAAYADLFISTETVTDEYWIEARRLYASLSAGDQQVLLRIMRQVAIDAVSTLFGIFDGTTPIAERLEKFELKHGGTRLSGDLQDLFLGAIEDLEAED